MHNAALKLLGLDWHYSTLDTPSENLVATLDRLEADPDVVGCNVTVPHKLAVFEWLRGNGRNVADWAALAGAVNTLYRGPDGKFQGTSTDFQGAQNAIRSAIQAHRPDFPWTMAEVAILGTGGSAQTLAVGFAASPLEPSPRSISVHGRNLEKADAVASLAREHALPGRTISVGSLPDWEAPSNRPRIVCQTTTVGMETGDSRDQSPVPRGTVSGVDVAFDLVYKPHVTRFLSDAFENGALVVHGIDMLIGQGAQSLLHWLQVSSPDTASATDLPLLCKRMEDSLRENGVF
jgi:shikimate dehydrogenase